MTKRKAEIKRKTKETDIIVKLNIDGAGKSKIKTGIGFLDHMLELFAFWGKFDLEIIMKAADFKVDIHHANEDLGIVLGQAFKEAIGDKAGINRVGDASFPMEGVTATVTIDISGRGSFVWFWDQANIIDSDSVKKEGYEAKYAAHFFEAFAKQLGANLNIRIGNPSSDLHTTLEPVFKALGKALCEATQIDPRRKGIPSTKGIID